MERGNTNNRLVIVLSEHPALGMLLIPYIVETNPNSDELLLMEQAFHLSDKTIQSLNAIEQKAIMIARHYTEKYLMEVYSKEKNTAKFLKLLADKPELWKKVRHFIDLKLLQMVELARLNELPIYQKPNGTRVLYPHHLFKLCPEAVDAHFIFNYDGATLTYRLNCEYHEEPLRLTEDKPAIALTSTPTALVLGMSLYFFEHLPAHLLIPFTKKDIISIENPPVDKYINNILLPIARFYECTVKGIVYEEKHYPCKPILYFEETIYDTQLLKLNFQYNDKLFAIDKYGIKEKHLSCKDTDGETGVYYFYRDVEKELSFINQLLDEGLEQTHETHFKLAPNAKEKSLTEWISSHQWLLESVFTLNSKSKKSVYCTDKILVEQSYEKTVDWFELHIIVKVGGFSIPFQRFRRHILEEKREYTLPDGRFILLPEEWFSKYAGVLNEANDKEKVIRIRHSHVGLINSLLEPTPTTTELKESLTLPPPELKANLRPYQLKGYQWLMSLYEQGYGGCLADDMGLGKTLQTLAFLQQVHHLKPKPTYPWASLIVMPTSLIHNWKSEVKKFTKLSFFEFAGNHRVTAENIEAKFNQYHLILISYGMLRNHVELLEKYNFECMVLDESQNIKNSESQTFRSVVRLNAEQRLILTGTPIENSLNDLWAQFHFIQPDLLGNEPTFNKHYATPIAQGDEVAQFTLRQLITPFLLRRTKQEVTPELPPLTERVVYCPMNAEQQKVYDKEKNSLRHELLQMTDINNRERFTILNGITRLRQLACQPKLVIPDFKESSGKMERIIETFETLQSEGHKVLIFSSFVKHLELISQEFEQRGWKYAWLTGASSNRHEEINLFSKSQETQAFFISLKAGGVGLNLVEAGYVFIIDPWWNPAAEAQAIARAHRIGQQKKVIAYRFITTGSIEEKIILLQEKKRRMASSLIVENNLNTTVSDKEWVELLK